MVNSLFPEIWCREMLAGAFADSLVNGVLDFMSDDAREQFIPKDDQNGSDDEHGNGHFESPQANVTERDFRVGQVPAAIGVVSHADDVGRKRAFRVYRLKVPKHRPVRWIAFNVEGYHCTEDVQFAATWPSVEGADLVKDALLHEQALEVEIVEGFE